MKKLLFTIFYLFLFTYPPALAEQSTVPFVDLTRYVGKWYEIAAIPQSFQKDCMRDVTAEYSMEKNGKLKVINSCIDAENKRKFAEGRAKVVDTETNAKLKVTFVKFIDWIFAFAGDYWVIDLDANYNHSVVGHPSKKYAWILSRNPTLSDRDLREIQLSLEEQGYDSCQLLMTIQSNGVQAKTPLCEYVK